MTKRAFCLSLVFVVCCTIAFAQVRFHDEANDTLKLNALLSEVADLKLKSPGDNMMAFAERLMDVPYAGHTLEQQPEMLTVNVDELDCTTFVETVMALAMTVGEHRTSWRDFCYNLQHIRYRGGTVKGYPSRLHYITDWAVDNISRGNIKDATKDFPRFGFIVKTINFMSTNADKYEALSDPDNLEAIKDVELGYRSHRFPYIKASDTGSKPIKAEFADGDILAFTTSIKNLDITHMGLVKIKDGDPYMVHASSTAGKVVMTEVPLDVFLKRNRQFTGVRVFRLQSH